MNSIPAASGISVRVRTGLRARIRNQIPGTTMAGPIKEIVYEEDPIAFRAVAVAFIGVYEFQTGKRPGLHGRG